eukprot:11659116-Alexandrium_andersonii.AAC.1
MSGQHRGRWQGPRPHARAAGPETEPRSARPADHRRGASRRWDWWGQQGRCGGPTPPSWRSRTGPTGPFPCP